MSSSATRPTNSNTWSPQLPKSRCLRMSLGDGLFSSLMVSLAEFHFPLLCIQLGFGEIAAGQIAVIPVSIGAIVQFFCLSPISRLAPNRQLVVHLALLQSVSLGVMGVLLYINQLSFLALVGMTSIYWIAGSLSMPLWNVWINSLVMPNERIAFYSLRTLIVQLGVIIGIILSTLMLVHGFESTSHNSFVVLFFGAALCRLASVGFLKQKLSSRIQSRDLNLNPFHHWRWVKNKQNLYVVLFFFTFHFTVALASPYFSPFLLEKLRLSNLDFMILVGSPILTRMIFYHFFRTVTEVRSIQSALVIGLVSLSVIPFGWHLFQNFYWLLFLQLMAGICWGAFELSVFLFLFESHADQERSQILAWTTLGNAVATALGMYLGAEFLRYYAMDYQAYLYLFSLSAALRFLSLLWLPAFIGRDINVRPIFFAIVAIRQHAGALVRPLFYK